MNRKTRIILALLLIVTLVVTIFTGCSPTVKESEQVSEEGGNKDSNKDEEMPLKPQVLVYNASSDVNAYDPRNADGLDQRVIINVVFEGLLRRNENGQVEAGMAEKWDVSDDGTTYTFHLRDNITWSDGEAVAASDFEYAWKSGLNPELGSRSVDLYFDILNAKAYYDGENGVSADDVGVKAIDNNTLEVKLEFASPFALDYFASPGLSPVRKDITEEDQLGWATRAETYIGNGPFKLMEWSPKEEMVFVKNENYWNKDAVKLDELRFVFISEETTALAAFRTEEIDVIESIPATDIETLMDEGHGFITPMLATYYYSINMESIKDPEVKKALAIREVREALSLAINRPLITENILKGGQVPAYAMTPIGIIDSNGEDYTKQKKYIDPAGDVEKAKELLAQAGYANGEGFPEVSIFYNTSQSHAAVAQAVQDMWKTNLGINATLVNKETKVFSDERVAGAFEITRSGNMCANTHPAILELFTTDNIGAKNEPRYSNSEYDAIIEKAKKETDVAKMFELYRQAEDILMEDLPVIPIYFYTNVLAKQKDVEGLYKEVTGAIRFDRVHIK